MDGVMLVDKPSGPTSFDVVRLARRAFGTRKIGHAGTLDPMASGLLVVCVGEGTKLVPYLMDGEKRYIADVEFGTQTDTDDAMGEVIETAPIPKLEKCLIENVLKGFVGEIEQVPPIYSALKRDGEALYRKARRGETVEVSSRIVRIDELKLLDVEDDGVRLDIICGKGTYIRSLARDLGVALGTVGHLRGLRRVASSGFNVEDATPLSRMEEEAQLQEGNLPILPLSDALRSLVKVGVGLEQETELRFGRGLDLETLQLEIIPERSVGIIAEDGVLIGIGRVECGYLRPIRLINRITS